MCHFCISPLNLRSDVQGFQAVPKPKHMLCPIWINWCSRQLGKFHRTLQNGTYRFLPHCKLFVLLWNTRTHLKWCSPGKNKVSSLSWMFSLFAFTLTHYSGWCNNAYWDQTISCGGWYNFHVLTFQINFFLVDATMTVVTLTVYIKVLYYIFFLEIINIITAPNLEYYKYNTLSKNIYYGYLLWSYLLWDILI